MLLDAAQRSQEQMHAKLMALCAQQVPGDTQRNLQIHPSIPSRTFKHVSCRSGCCRISTAPRRIRWSSTATPGRLPGDRPYSAWKIVFAIVAAIIAALDCDSAQQPIVSAEAEASALLSSFCRCVLPPMHPFADVERTL